MNNAGAVTTAPASYARNRPHPPRWVRAILEVVLVMGLAAQLVHWREGFLDALVERRLHIVRFDNRDSGRSTHLQSVPPANLPAALAGDLSSVTYTLSDMASGQLLKVVATDAGSLRDFQAFARQTGNELVEQQTVGEEFIHVLRRR